MKQAERELTGSEDVSDGVEMAGWGLEEATEQNKKDASKYSLRSRLYCCRLVPAKLPPSGLTSISFELAAA